MSQFYVGLTSGEVPIPPNVAEQYTTDNGIAVPENHNLYVFGQKSLTSQVMMTTATSTTSGLDTIEIENRAYITRYVVDYQSAIGARGTYIDIQSAVNAAVADSTSQTGTIYIRPGNYSGNVVVPGSAKLSFVAFDPIYTISSGLWTFGVGCAVQFYGIIFDAPSGQTSLTIPNNTVCIFDNCSFSGVDGTSNSISISGYSDPITFSNCSFYSNLLIAGSTIDGAGPIFQACGIFTSMIFSSTGICSLFDCLLDNISLSGASQINMYNCTIRSTAGLGGAAITGSSSALSQIYNCTFYTNGGIGISAFASFLLAGNSGVYTQSNGIQNLFNSSPTISYIATQSGNVSQVTLPAGGYTITLGDSFVGIDTTSARTVNMYATPYKGLTYTIADITGSAGANNITVNGNGSNIDGSSSYTIGANYASITLVYTGTIWKVI